METRYRDPEANFLLTAFLMARRSQPLAAQQTAAGTNTDAESSAGEGGKSGGEEEERAGVPGVDQSASDSDRGRRSASEGESEDEKTVPSLCDPETERAAQRAAFLHGRAVFSPRKK